MTKMQCLLLPFYSTGDNRAVASYYCVIKCIAQSSPRCPHHICMPETWWQTAFWLCDAPHQVYDGYTSIHAGGEGSWCSGEIGEMSRLPC